MAKSNIKRPRITKFVREKVLSLRDNGLSPAEVVSALRKGNNGKAPSLRAVQLIFQKAKITEGTDEFQEQMAAWHVGLTSATPLDAAVIARVLDLKAWLRSQVKSDVITVRQVSWIARLHVRLPENDDLWIAARLYAQEETIFGYYGEGEFDTTLFDRLLSPGIRQRLKTEQWWFEPGRPILEQPDCPIPLINQIDLLDEDEIHLSLETEKEGAE